MVVRTASPGMIGRAATASLVVALLVSSSVQAQASDQSGGESSAEGSPAPTAPAPTAPVASGTGPIASVTTPLPADPGFAAEIVALGLDEATAAFMAQTLSTVEVVDAHTYVVRHAFPNGATGEVTYHLFQAAGMSPEDPPESSGEVLADEYRYQMRYAIDSSEFPEDLRELVLAGLPVETVTGSIATAGVVHELALAPMRPVSALLAADSPGTVEVVVDGVISQGQGAALDKFVEFGEKQGYTKSARSWEAYKAGKQVWEAVEANEIVADALAKLKQLRKCAENPTNKGTKEKYASDPQEKQSVLDELTRLENEVRQQAMATFGMQLTDVGSSLIKAAPWLGFITGPAANYVKTNFQNLVKDYLRQAEQRVVPCRHSYKINGSIRSKPGGITLSGKACSLEKPFTVKTQGDIVGRFEFSPRGETGGTWSYAGSERKVGFGVDGYGGYTVSLNEDKTSGTLDFAPILKIHIPSPGKSQSGGGPAKLTLSEVPLCE